MIGQDHCLSLCSPAPPAAARWDWSNRLARLPAEGALAALRSSVAASSVAPCWQPGVPRGDRAWRIPGVAVTLIPSSS